MRKIEIEFDAKAVDEYVLKLKEKLPQYDINVYKDILIGH